MNHKVRIFILLLSFFIAFSLTGCDNKISNQVTPNIITSGKNQPNLQEFYSENNGGMYVKYNNEIYFREYTKTSEEEKYIWANYWYKANEPKMVKKIKADGTTEALFMDNGYGGFYLLDDRFFGYADGILYSVNLKGDDYIKLGEGEFLQADEQNHQLYYIDKSSEGDLFSVDTLSLTATKLTDKKYQDYLCVYEGNTYYPVYQEGIVTKFNLMKYNFETRVESYLTTLEDTRNEDDDYISIYDACHIDDYIVKENKLYALVGTSEGTAQIFGNGNLFEIDLVTGEKNLLATNVDAGIVLDGNRLYYFDMNMEMGSYEGSYHSIDTNTKEVRDEDYLFPFILAKDGVKACVTNENELTLVYEDGSKKFVFTSSDVANIESKYLSNYLDEERYVDLREIEILDHKVFYKVQASVLDPQTDIGWRIGYKHIASEIHSYDMLNHTDVIIYDYEI